MHGRRTLALIIVAGGAVFALLALGFGYDRAWQLWNIPTMDPHFADARAITAGAETYRAGLDPMVANPADPWRRPMNYPRIWQSLFRLGIDQGDTLLLAGIMIVAFLAGLFLFVDRFDRLTGFLLALAIFSPAVLLGIERANNDLLMFFLLAAALLALRRSAVVSGLLITAAALLMLFPVFGLACLLRARRRVAVAVAAASLAVMAGYAALFFDDIVLISRGAQRGTDLSYGFNVAWMSVRDALGSTAGWLVGGASAVLLVVILVRTLGMVREGRIDAHVEHAQNLDAFRLGAAVYVGTFLVGNNWDYRLMFLIFCLPQLVAWGRAADRDLSRTARLTLAAVLVSLWLQFFYRFAGLVPFGGHALFALDEAANWSAFAGLVFLVPRALPRELSRRLISGRFRPCPEERHVPS